MESKDLPAAIRALREAAARSAAALGRLGDTLAGIAAARLIEELEWDLRLHELGIDFDLLCLFDP